MTIQTARYIEKSYTKIVEISRKMWYNSCVEIVALFLLPKSYTAIIANIAQSVSSTFKSAYGLDNLLTDWVFFIGPYTTENARITGWPSYRAFQRKLK